MKQKVTNLQGKQVDLTQRFLKGGLGAAPSTPSYPTTNGSLSLRR